jgi:hypothetical protein
MSLHHHHVCSWSRSIVGLSGFFTLRGLTDRAAPAAEAQGD